MDVDHNFAISDFGIKCNGISEFYFILTNEGRLYLQPKRE